MANLLGNYVVRNVLFGCAVFAGISVAGRLPLLGWVVGWFGWVLAIGAWIWLASKLVTEGRDSLALSTNPRIPAMSFSALMGAAAGFVGALVSLVLNLVAFSLAGDSLGAAMAASAGTARDTIGLFIRPILGAMICGLAGLGFAGNIMPRERGGA